MWNVDVESRDDRILAPFHSTIECTSARFNVDPSKFHCSHRIDHAIIIAHIDLPEDAGEARGERVAFYDENRANDSI